MACSSQPLASQLAVSIMQAGGNAVDAAIAANTFQGLAEPVSCGVGGDIFVLLWEAKSHRLHGYNGSGRSPRGLTLERLTADGATTIPRVGPLPVSVPGCVDGWHAVHARFGRLPMAEVLAPTIAAAREGVPIAEYTASLWARNAEILKDFPNYAQTFMPGGRAPAKGEVFRNPDLASTLDAIARGGREAFYRGDMARVVGGYMHRQGGYLSYEDLAAHEGEWVDPVSTNYRGYDVWELPPNGQGIAVLQMLNILEAYDLRAAGWGSLRHLHLLLEAKKLAFEDRAKFYADPAFNEIPVAWLIGKEYAAERRALIDEHRAAHAYPAGEQPPAHSDTIYLTTADREGNMVSLIQSNFRGAGSGMVPDGLGFSLQTRGESFSLRPGHFNSYAPGKRPFHTIIPAFVTKNGAPWLSFGVMGADMQPQGHVQILLNVIDFGMNLQEAGDAPRVYHEGSSDPTGAVMHAGGVVHLETGFPTSTVEGLRAMGHTVVVDHQGVFGGYQAIGFNAESGVYTGASESRSDGQAVGY